MHRLDRKIVLLHGKRAGAFDPNQPYLERALRARAARKTRHALRRMRPVVLHTPRWSMARQFLDDVGADLRLGSPQIYTRTLSMAPTVVRPLSQTWQFVLAAMVEFCELQGQVTTGAVADRNGFRNQIAQMLRLAQRGAPRALLIHEAETLNVAVLADIVEVFSAYADEYGEDRRFNLLIASAISGPNMQIPGAEHVELADYSPVEAVEALVEVLGPSDGARLAEAVRVVGGVPALLLALGDDGADAGTLATGRDAIWRALGPLAEEVRTALDRVTSDDRLAERLEHVARTGNVERDDAAGDGELERAGLLAPIRWGRPNRVALRAPVFAELVLG